MRTYKIKYLIISVVTVFFWCLLPGKQLLAQEYDNYMGFKIDSARISSDGKAMEYSIMFWRETVDWSGGGLQDTLLGPTDLYFTIKPGLFDEGRGATFVRRHPSLDCEKSYLVLNAAFHAERFRIWLDAKNTLLG